MLVCFYWQDIVFTFRTEIVISFDMISQYWTSSHIVLLVLTLYWGTEAVTLHYMYNANVATLQVLCYRVSTVLIYTAKHLKFTGGSACVWDTNLHSSEDELKRCTFCKHSRHGATVCHVLKYMQMHFGMLYWSFLKALSKAWFCQNLISLHCATYFKEHWRQWPVSNKAQYCANLVLVDVEHIDILGVWLSKESAG